MDRRLATGLALHRMSQAASLDSTARETRRQIAAFSTAIWHEGWFHMHRALIQQEIARATLPHAPYISFLDAYSFAVQAASPGGEDCIMLALPGGLLTIEGPPTPSPLIHTLAPLIAWFDRQQKPPPLGFRERVWTAFALMWPADSSRSLAELLLPIAPGSKSLLSGAVAVDAEGAEPERQFLQRLTTGAERIALGQSWDGRARAGKRAAYPTRKTFVAAILREVFALRQSGVKAKPETVAERLNLSFRQFQRLEQTHRIRWRLAAEGRGDTAM